MIKISLADGLIDKLEYSSYEDYETYPSSIYFCDICGEKVGFAFKDLEKHRFSKRSNLNGNDKSTIDKLILSMIPYYKLKQGRQISSLSKQDRLKVLFQRMYLRILGFKEKFLPIPSIKEQLPDSFLDFYCPKCAKPIRIYYYSYLGGRQGENGYILKYIIN